MDIDKIIERNKRLEELIKMYQSYDFGKGHIYILGQGSIGPSLLYMILKIFIIKQNQITVIDMKPIDQLTGIIKYVVGAARPNEKLDIEIISKMIEENNYKDIFSQNGKLKLTKNDIVIDCSFDICTLDLFKLCQESGCGFVSSSLESWNYKDINDPYSYTLHSFISELREYVDSLKKNKIELNFNGLIDMGCNPGMVNIWAQLAVDKINEHYGNKKHKTAEELDIRTVHISEYDTQRSVVPKEIDEYCNTWASTCEPFYEEALAPVEMSFGSHEEKPQQKYIVHLDDNDKYISLNRLCSETVAQSYTPGYKNYIGILIRHAENLTIGEALSTYEEKDGKKIRKWSPSVYYVYHPTNETMASVCELKEKNYKYQSKTRLLTKEILDGRDELGLSFFLGNGDIFWIGSLLDVHEARDVYEQRFNDKINATIVQVIGGYLSGIMHVLDKNKKGEYSGLLIPDDLPYKQIYERMKPFYGEFVFKKVEDWDSNMNTRSLTFKEFKEGGVNKKPEWTLKDFLIEPHIFGYDVPKTIEKGKIGGKAGGKKKRVYQKGGGAIDFNNSQLGNSQLSNKLRYTFDKTVSDMLQ
jgi:homospermidine synthase